MDYSQMQSHLQRQQQPPANTGAKNGRPAPPSISPEAMADFQSQRPMLPGVQPQGPVSMPGMGGQQQPATGSKNGRPAPQGGLPQSQGAPQMGGQPATGAKNGRPAPQVGGEPAVMGTQASQELARLNLGNGGRMLMPDNIQTLQGMGRLPQDQTKPLYNSRLK